LCAQEGANPFVSVVEMCGGVDRIEELQRHENHKIYDMAVKILENYFGADEEEEPMADQQAGGFQYRANVNAPQGGFQFGGMPQ
jgi:importin subunit alpha-1